MKIGLFFGTFNPVHNGHLAIANHMAEFSDLDQVWFVVTPQSPFKKKSTLLSNNHRYQMIDRALEHYPKLRVSDIEFGLSKPNYTINTLLYLEEKYPDLMFALIMGEDNLKSFHKWKNYETILDNHEIYCYPRITEGKAKTIFEKHPKIHKIDAPIIQISATLIRQGIKNNKNVEPMLPKEVWKYIDEMNFYRT